MMKSKKNTEGILQDIKNLEDCYASAYKYLRENSKKLEAIDFVNKLDKEEKQEVLQNIRGSKHYCKQIQNQYIIKIIYREFCKVYSNLPPRCKEHLINIKAYILKEGCNIQVEDVQQNFIYLLYDKIKRLQNGLDQDKELKAIKFLTCGLWKKQFNRVEFDVLCRAEEIIFKKSNSLQCCKFLNIYTNKNKKIQPKYDSFEQDLIYCITESLKALNKKKIIRVEDIRLKKEQIKDFIYYIRSILSFVYQIRELPLKLGKQNFESHDYIRFTGQVLMDYHLKIVKRQVTPPKYMFQKTDGIYVFNLIIQNNTSIEGRFKSYHQIKGKKLFIRNQFSQYFLDKESNINISIMDVQNHDSCYHSTYN